jgi:hypothetical protein
VVGLYYNNGVCVMDSSLSTCVDKVFGIRKCNCICNLKINVNIYCPPTFGSPCIMILYIVNMYSLYTRRVNLKVIHKNQSWINIKMI